MRFGTIRGTAIAAVAAVTLTAAGCATVPGPYAYYPAPRAQSVEMGVVEGVRPLEFQGPTTGAGAVSGAALGGWAGSGIGAGSGNAAAIVGGVILGSLIGNALEVEATRRPGVELTVRLDAGRTIAVVQDAVPGEAFRPGDRIRVVSDGYRTRIVY
jgi:outer membrane lipoprotein SlyB